MTIDDTVATCSREPPERVALELTARGLRGELTLAGLDVSWPPALTGAFWDGVRDDLESAVAHLPSGVFDRRLLVEQWSRDWDYLRLYLDDSLIRSGLDVQAMTAARAEATARDLETTGSIDRYVQNLVSR